MRVDTESRLPANGGGSTPHDPFAVCAKVSRGALSGNTERAMRSDLAIFNDWCSERALSALPACEDTVAAFVDAMARVRTPATVRRYVASIAAAHRALGEVKVTSSESVRRALQRMHRQKGRRQVQAEGLNWTLRERLHAAAGEGLIDARNRALLAVAYDTLLRRGELVGLQVSDIVEQADGTATVLVRRSKGDPEGYGAQAYVARDSMVLVHAWLERSGISDGRLFRPLSRGVLGERMGAGEVSRIFKRMARKAGLPAEVVACISGHSTRVGAAQDMVAHGVGMAAILHAGRWKTTTMVNRYGERLIARRSGAAQLARLQLRE